MYISRNDAILSSNDNLSGIMPEAKFACELEQIYHRLYDIRCEAINIYWENLEEPNPFESISRLQILMLLYIAEVAPCPLQKVISRTGLTKGAVSVATRKLIERRLLTVSPGSEDHRERIIELTPHARRHIENIDILFDSLLQKRMPQYNSDDFNHFYHRLRHLNLVLSGGEICCSAE